jgi:hypothetical protein
MKPLPPIDGYIHGERAKLSARDLILRRAIVDRLGMFDEVCPRARCRRAKACRSLGVVCFDEEREMIIELMWEIIIEGYVPDPNEWEED